MLKDSLRKVSQEATERFWAKVDKGGECWLWTGSRTPSGHGQLSVRALSSKPIRAHRFSFYLEHGRWPEPACLHTCDVASCVNPAHLYEGDQVQNMRDRKERNPRWGARNPNAKHSDNVEEIRAAVRSGELQRVVAERYGTTQGVVSRIARGVNFPEGTC